MKLQSFSQFITESAVTVSTVESKISATAHTLLPEKAWVRARKYLSLDFNVLIKRAAVTATEIFTDLGTALNNPNFDPKTIEAEALKFEQALYNLTDREVDLIMQDLNVLGQGLLFAFKRKWKEDFLAQNSDLANGHISLIIEEVIYLALDAHPDYYNTYGQKQLVKAGKPAPPFKIRLANGKTISYGTYKDHQRPLFSTEGGVTWDSKSRFGDGSTQDGCYQLDYWEAMKVLLEDRKPRIVKTIVDTILAKVFS